VRELVLWALLASCGGNVARGPCFDDAGPVALRECVDALRDGAP
jgi:hypothetical protein